MSPQAPRKPRHPASSFHCCTVRPPGLRRGTNEAPARLGSIPAGQGENYRLTCVCGKPRVHICSRRAQCPTGHLSPRQSSSVHNKLGAEWGPIW